MNDTATTLEDDQVSSLTLNTVTVENATIEKLHVQHLNLERGANAPAAVGLSDRATAAALADIAIPSLTLTNVSVVDLGVQDAGDQAHQLINDDTGDLVVRNATVKVMNVTTSPSRTCRWLIGPTV